MKISIIIISSLILLSVSGCVVPASDLNNANAEITRLESELDECQNGEARIIAEIEGAKEMKNYSAVKISIMLLAEKHPESPKNEEYQEFLKKVEKLEAAEMKKEAAAEKERKRKAELNKMGIWQRGYYVDDFGKKTNQYFITTKDLIRGTFSNTATEDSRLIVKFYINSYTNITFELYEYAGNNPVKAYSLTNYKVLVQDKDGKRYNLTATNNSSRLYFGVSSSKKMHSIFKKGGQIEFRITETRSPTTKYKFAISNADYYYNAYKKL